MSEFLVWIYRDTKVGMRRYTRWFSDERDAVDYAVNKWNKMNVKGEIRVYRFSKVDATTVVEDVYSVQRYL